VQISKSSSSTNNKNAYEFCQSDVAHVLGGIRGKYDCRSVSSGQLGILSVRLLLFKGRRRRKSGGTKRVYSWWYRSRCVKGREHVGVFTIYTIYTYKQRVARTGVHVAPMSIFRVLADSNWRPSVRGKLVQPCSLCSITIILRSRVGLVVYVTSSVSS
jgi:hypothetical protein